MRFVLIGLVLAVGSTSALGQVCPGEAERLQLAPEPLRIGLGYSVASDGAFLVSGLPFDDLVCRDGNEPCDPNGDTGAVAVYRRDGGWQHETTLTALFPAPGDRFGSDMGFYENQLLIGASGRGANGSISLYERGGDQWNLRRVLGGSALAPDAGFGHALAIAEDLLVVGSPLHFGRDRNTGAAHIFAYEQGAWDEVARLEPNDLGLDDGFGWDVATDGDLVAVSAPGIAFGDTPGAVYLFDRSDGFTQVARLEGDALSREFGYSVAVQDDRLVIGAPGQSLGAAPNRQNRGAVYLYEDDDGWQLQGLLSDASGMPGDRYGNALALRDTTLVVTAPGKGGNRGAAWSYGYAFGRWDLSAPLAVADGLLGAGSLLGWSIALFPDGVAMGAGLGDFTSTAGAVYVLPTTPKACVGDVNGDCRVDLADLARLLTRYGASGNVDLTDGDIDASGEVDMPDLELLLASFGCRD